MITRWKTATLSLPQLFQDSDEIVFYHIPSGSIHLINALGLKILNALSERPLTFDELVDKFPGHDINTFSAINVFLKIGVQEGFIDEIQE